MVNIYCNFHGTKNGTIRFCFLPDKSKLFLKKRGNVKLNCHTLRIGLSGFGLLLLRVTVAVKRGIHGVGCQMGNTKFYY